MFHYWYKSVLLVTNWKKNTLSQLGQSKNKEEMCRKIDYQKQRETPCEPNPLTANMAQINIVTRRWAASKTEVQATAIINL